MNKHDNTDYWDCKCRSYGPRPEDKFYPDDSCEPLHYNHVIMLEKIELLIKSIKEDELLPYEISDKLKEMVSKERN